MTTPQALTIAEAAIRVLPRKNEFSCLTDAIVGNSFGC